MDAPRVGVRFARACVCVMMLRWFGLSLCLYLSRCCSLVLCLVHSSRPPQAPPLTPPFVHSLDVMPADSDSNMSTRMYDYAMTLLLRSRCTISRRYVTTHTLFKMD